jgi:glutathione S-transferase
LYLDPPLRALFFQMDPKTRDADVVKQSQTDLGAKLDYLEGRIGTPWAAGEAFSLADCALAPTIWYVRKIAPLFGAADPFASRPRLRAWFARVQERPSVKRALEAQGQALAARMSGQK